MRVFIFIIGLFCFSFYCNLKSYAQQQGGALGTLQSFGSSFSQLSNVTVDSFQERNYQADSVEVTYNLINQSTKFTIDSAINNLHERLFTKRYYVNTGNDASPAFSLIYEPNPHIGWSLGMNSFNNILFTEDNVKIYNTTFPFARLGYLFGSNELQTLNFLYTHNITSQLNFGGEFKNFASPGFYKNQNTYNSSFYAYVGYETLNKVYKIMGVVTTNTIQASDNGGVSDVSLLSPNSPETYYNRNIVPVYLGDGINFTTNILSNTVAIGHQQNYGVWLLTHSLSLGAKKTLTIIKDTDKKNPVDGVKIQDTTYRFYRIPKVTITHRFKRVNSQDVYKDQQYALSQKYYLKYNPILFATYDPNNKTGLLEIQQQFINMSNLLSVDIHSGSNFNDKITLSAELFNTQIKGKNHREQELNYANSNIELSVGSNKTIFKKYQLFLNLKYYKFGILSSDAIFETNYAFIGRIEDMDKGHKLSFFASRAQQNFYSLSQSVFYLDTIQYNLSPENKISVSLETYLFKKIKFKLTNTSISNLLYYTDYETPRLNTAWLNTSQIFLQKKFSFRKKWFWELQLNYQPDLNFMGGKTLQSYLPLPTLWTFNSFYFQKTIQKKMLLGTGLEVIYASPYKAPNYSAILSKMIVQDSVTISNLPQFNIFFSFRIRGFYLYYRMDNLQTVFVKNWGLYYIRNNMNFPNYPANELTYKFGIFWNLVN